MCYSVNRAVNRPELVCLTRISFSGIGVAQQFVKLPTVPSHERMPTPDRPRTEASSNLPRLIGRSAAWIRTREMAARIARGRTKVLVTGESGVGKDLVARYLHAHSDRADEPFVAVNCASASETLLESELFGHERGSATGALRSRIGKLRQAHRGTIFLDEIGEMGLRVQGALLRFLEGGEVRPVGSDAAPTCVDVRIIAATSKDLFALVGEGRFREDLLYRINVSHITVPPLRERREDIPLFVEHVLADCGRRIPLSGAVMRALESYHWPGNVRELQNVIEQMASVARGPAIELEDLPPRILAATRSSFVPRRERRRRVADDLYDQLLSRSCGFWEDIRPLLLNRDMTRADLRQLVGLGLAASGGTYRGLLDQFGLPQQDYKRLLNFLAAHDCSVDCREFRSGDGPRTSSGAGPQGRRQGASMA
jgi:transcriptional regulator with PAS, ATPase and Fis domain